MSAYAAILTENTHFYFLNAIVLVYRVPYLWYSPSYQTFLYCQQVHVESSLKNLSLFRVYENTLLLY